MKHPFYTKFLLAPALASILLFSCKSRKNNEKEIETTEHKIEVEIKETEVNGKRANVYTLSNQHGMRVSLSSFGGLITELAVPDKDGNIENIVLHYESIAEYDNNDSYLGATVGRYANRIANGKFSLDGTEYQLATNDGKHHLHGGLIGFHRKFWDHELITEGTSVKVKMSYVSPDGEEGYPGTLSTSLTFELTQDNTLLLDFEASTDKPTVLNLTHHGYFNLSAMNEDIRGHEMQIFADKYTPADETLIPTSELAPVDGTPFDFRQPFAIGDRIGDVTGGYDHNYVIKEQHDDRLIKMAVVHHAGSGRYMELYADSPGVQFYTGNFLDGRQTTRGIQYSKHMGLCLEPQVFPNSPNTPSFPSARLNPGENYRHRIQYHFGVR
ncbi:MAG: galactose mutarotase [Cyclobacteriaceae bacterium]|nr:galactose mutarotase [Cyclobacteriaceae bacterium]